MESSSSKTEAMIKPLFLKAGIPLVLSIAGIVSARIISRRSIVSVQTKVSSLETIGSDQEFRDHQENFDHGVNNNSVEENEEQTITSSNEFFSSEGEILSFKRKIEELQERERDLEIQFLKYQEMKKQESVLIEIKNMLVLESAHVEFLDREISLFEADKERVHNLVLEYLRILEQLQFAKMENGILRRKAKRISRKVKDQSRVIREKNLKIEATEGEILKLYDELETRTTIIKKMEDEVRELQDIVNQLQEEKNGLLIKLNAAENSTAKVDAESVAMEDHKQIVNEIEQLRRDRAAENADLTYLRWTNACLRHELMRSNEQEQQMEEKKEQSLELELDAAGGEISNYGLEQKRNESFVDAGTRSQAQGCSKRKKLLHKIKRWVEGNDHHMKLKPDEKEQQEIKCIGRFSVSEEAEQDHFIHARRSCSSA